MKTNMMTKKWGIGLSLVLALVLVFMGCKKDDDENQQVQMKVNSYYPNSGKAGTLVTIEGEGFGTSLSEYSATVGGKNADMVSATSNSLVVRMPADGVSGNLILKLGENTYDVGKYTYQDLSVRNVYPANGPAGAQIRISGEGFASIKDPASVFINSKSALVVSVTDTLIVAEVPEEAGYGPVTVKVDGKEAAGRNFTFQAIRGIKPLSGGASTRVVITGVGFEQTTAGNIVDFNGKPAEVLEANATQIIVRAPDGVTTGPLSISINSQKITGSAFTVVGHPVINTVSPLSGPRGAEMTITGDIFSTQLDENKVFINNVEVPVQSATKNQLKLVVPGGTGSGNVRVVVNDQATNGPQFKDQTLGISGLTPDNGLAGSTITIRGTGFSATASANQVYFNGLLAPVKTATETSLVLDAPAGVTTGNVRVVVGALEATSPQPFKRAGVMTIAGGTVNNAIGNYAQGIAIDSHDNIYVTNPADGYVKKISPSGVVTNLQANGVDVKFTYPSGIAIDKNDNIFVADQNANQVRRITPSGQNTVYTSGFSPKTIAIDATGNLYVSVNTFAGGMNKVFPAGNYSKLAGPSWIIYRPVVDEVGNLYYPDQNTNGNNGLEVLRSSATGSVGFVGGYYDGALVDGIGISARFNGIMSVVVNKPGELMVADGNNRALRLVETATARVSTLIRFNPGYADGTLTSAQFSGINDLAIGKDGSIYVLDMNNRAVRKIFLQ